MLVAIKLDRLAQRGPHCRFRWRSDAEPKPGLGDRANPQLLQVRQLGPVGAEQAGHQEARYALAVSADAMALCFSEPEGSAIPRSRLIGFNRVIEYEAWGGY